MTLYGMYRVAVGITLLAEMLHPQAQSPTLGPDANPALFGIPVPLPVETEDVSTPSQDEFRRLLPPVGRGIPGLFEISRDPWVNTLDCLAELMEERIDSPKSYPLIGRAQLHHSRWKCKLWFSDTITGTCVPFQFNWPRTAVVFLDREHLQKHAPTEKKPLQSDVAALQGTWREVNPRKKRVELARVVISEQAISLETGSQTLGTRFELEEDKGIRFMRVRILGKSAHLAYSILDDRMILISEAGATEWRRVPPRGNQRK